MKILNRLKHAGFKKRPPNGLDTMRKITTRFYSTAVQAPVGAGPLPGLARRLRRIHTYISELKFSCPKFLYPKFLYWGFLRDCRGGSAVEFAMVAPAFFLLLMGTIETSTMFFVSTVMEGAAVDAARQVRTGQVQNAGDPLVTFQNELCAQVFNIVDCSNIIFDVRSFPDFTSTTPLQFDADGNPINTGFAPGGASTVTVVRVTYRWDFFTPMIGIPMSDNGTNSRLLLATNVFQNEPY